MVLNWIVREVLKTFWNCNYSMVINNYRLDRIREIDFLKIQTFWWKFLRYFWLRSVLGMNEFFNSSDNFNTSRGNTIKNRNFKFLNRVLIAMIFCFMRRCRFELIRRIFKNWTCVQVWLTVMKKLFLPLSTDEVCE